MSYIESSYVKDLAKEHLFCSDGVTMGKIQSLMAECHQRNVNMGWWTNPYNNEPKARNFGELVALIHSELSEALEGDRRKLPSDKIPGFTSVEEEFADVLIRLFDTAAAMNLNLGAAYVAKTRYNSVREDHKLVNRVKAGGKEY